MRTKTISGPNLLAQYLRLREQGWKTLWTGEGKICLIKETLHIHALSPET
jgi:hypothetical protein